MEILCSKPPDRIDPKSLKILLPRGTYSDLSAKDPPAKSSENILNNIEPSLHDDTSSFALDKAKPLEPISFPNQPRNGSNQIPATIPNVQHLLLSYGITARYNIIKKKLWVSVPGLSGAPDNIDNVALAQIMSLATLNGMPIGQVLSFVDAIGDRYQHNPVADWIISKKWDGINRLPDIYATLVSREEYPQNLKQQLMYRWLVSAVAAALIPSGFRSRGVLTLQGPQSIGKTAWVNALVPDLILREGVVKLDHHLDAGNKDSLITAISHWIVEIGELDGSLRKDIARLKGFLTGDRDKVRKPYGRTDSEYPRRTVFCATVNDPDFLVDATGNSRWWAIPVTKINYSHGIDMQQLFAQLAVDYQNGEPWWLTSEEESVLEWHNNKHRTISAIREHILSAVDLDRSSMTNWPAMTAIEVLKEIKIDYPTNPQCKECAAILRELFGESKRIKGQNKWRIPLMQKTYSPTLSANDDDRY